MQVEKIQNPRQIHALGYLWEALRSGSEYKCICIQSDTHRISNSAFDICGRGGSTSGLSGNLEALMILCRVERLRAGVGAQWALSGVCTMEALLQSATGIVTSLFASGCCNLSYNGR
jgi:hypothetical protein